MLDEKNRKLGPDLERKYYYVKILKVVKVYKPFESFGELALITNKSRKAKLEVGSEEDAHFALLSKEDYNFAMRKVHAALLEEKMDFLRQFELFKLLSNSNLNSISYSMVE